MTYAVSETTPADLRELWRATSNLETWQEFEQRFASLTTLETAVSLFHDETLLGMVEIHALPGNECWLGVSPCPESNNGECEAELFRLAGERLAGGCVNVWVLVTEMARAEQLLCLGWEPGNAVTRLCADGTETTAQWYGLRRETWLRAQAAVWS